VFPHVGGRALCCDVSGATFLSSPRTLLFYGSRSQQPITAHYRLVHLPGGGSRVSTIVTPPHNQTALSSGDGCAPMMRQRWRTVGPAHLDQYAVEPQTLPNLRPSRSGLIDDPNVPIDTYCSERAPKDRNRLWEGAASTLRVQAPPRQAPKRRVTSCRPKERRRAPKRSVNPLFGREQTSRPQHS
jgi:hypothetical protein